MAISDRLTKLTTDITNAYTSIENKGGTIPANKNTNNLPTAINSIEVIEQATAEGESLSLTNTKAMPYSDYVVKGKSEQATRSGKNLLQNTATSQTISGVTFTVNEDGSVTCNGTATNNIFFPLTENNSIENIILNGCPAGGSGNSYLIRAIDINGKVLKTDVGEGTGVFDLINARIQIRIAKDYICNNLTFYPMIRLATIEDDTYEPYGASPSPDYPSEIHSVADDVNLFDKITATVNQNNYVLNNDGTITNNKSWGNDGRTFFNNILLNTGTYTISYIPTLSGTNKNVRFSIKNIDSSTDIINQSVSITDGIKQTYSFSLSSNTNIAICIMPNGVNDGTLTLSEIKFQKGTVATPYSPYNQGTVTIKQRGKNLAYTGWAEDFVTRINLLNYVYIVTKDNKNCLFYYSGAGYGDYENKYMFKTEWKENTQYTIQCSILNTSEQITNNYNMTVHYTDGTYTHIFNSYQQNTWLNFKFTTALNKTVKYITSAYYAGDRYLDLDTFMIYEGTQETSYEPYQANNYTFQTEPLRSLPNGVKDTIEAEQHRKIGRQTGTLTETTTITLSDAKTNGAYMCNIKPSGTLTGKTIELEAGDYEIIYELETEVIEPLTQNQATIYLDIIKTGSYEGTTNIYTDEDVKPTIKADYYKKG